MLQAIVYQEKDHDFTVNPQDFELYQLGEYDDTTGKFDTYTPAHILNLNQLTHEEPPKNYGTAHQPAED